MRNYLGDGNLVTLTTPAAIATGAGLLSGGFFGITCAPAGAGESIECLRVGEFTVTKNSAEAWAVGDPIYWNDTTKVFTIAAAGNTPVGYATEVAANPSASGCLLLVPLPGGVSVKGVPVAFTTRALTKFDDSGVFTIATSATATVNQSMPAGFGAAFKGTAAFTAGSGVTITDVRTTGATYPWCSLVQTAANTYDVVGTKA